MNWRKHRRILEKILGSPTAPFHEYHVRDTLLELLEPYPHVSVEEDGFGNLIATYRRGRKRPRYAFGAHMDHPGWVRPAGQGKRSAASSDTPEWEFLGGVAPRHLEAPLAPIEGFGEFAMWKLPAMEIRDDLLYSRACDDLVNCATQVVLFDELERRGTEATCHALFTRAEEVGFVGAVKLAKAWPFPKHVCFVSLETSAPADAVVLGGGPILRVGDRLSVFDDTITREIASAAAAGKIDVQRCLLDRGACESSAFQVYGIPSGGISIALGNYHNCGDGGPIAPEYVSVSDVKAMAKLVTAMVEGSAAGGDVVKAFRKGLEDRVRKYAGHASATRKRFAGR